MAMEDSFQQSPKVLTFGEPLVAMVPNAEGTLSPMHELRPFPVGAELNTAVGLSRLGFRASFACCTGADPFGTFIRTAARAEGVDTEHMQASTSAPTAVLFKQWTGLQKRTSVYYYRQTSPMAVGHWNTDVLRSKLIARRWQWVHATGITWMIGEQSAASATELFELAAEAGVPVSFDVNVRLKLAGVEAWRQLLHNVLPCITWLFLGDEEARMLYETDSASYLEKELRERGFRGKGVIVKRGDQGATANVQGHETAVPVWPVTAVADTVGAGDGFNAGFIAGLLRGDTLAKAMQLGTVVGAFAVTSVGDYHGYPTWAEVIEEISNNRSVER